METRKDYIEKLAARLRAWDERIDELRDKADNATAELKIRYRQEMAELREMRERAAKHMVVVREASGDAWKTIRVDFGKMVRDVKKSFRKAA